jgi:hypothetical protein
VREIARLFFALWYLGGTLVHVFLAVFKPQGYQPFCSRAVIPLERELWGSFVMPNIRFFALTLAAFELAVGVLLLSKGTMAKLGLALSILFNLFLVQLGLGMPQTGWKGFLWNRSITLTFALLQVPLFLAKFEQSFPKAVGARFGRK